MCGSNYISNSFYSRHSDSEFQIVDMELFQCFSFLIPMGHLFTLLPNANEFSMLNTLTPSTLIMNLIVGTPLFCLVIVNKARVDFQFGQMLGKVL